MGLVVVAELKRQIRELAPYLVQEMGLAEVAPAAPLRAVACVPPAGTLSDEQIAVEVAARLRRLADTAAPAG